MKKAKIISVVGMDSTDKLDIPVIAMSGDTMSYELTDGAVQFTVKKARDKDEILDLVLKYTTKEQKEAPHRLVFEWAVAATEYIMTVVP